MHHEQRHPSTHVYIDTDVPILIYLDYDSQATDSIWFKSDSFGNISINVHSKEILYLLMLWIIESSVLDQFSPVTRLFED